MQSFSCRCGNTIEITPPSQHAGYVVWDQDVDLVIDSRTAMIRSFLNSILNGLREKWIDGFYGDSGGTRFSSKDDTDIIEDILSQHDNYTRHLIRCPTCKRIYIHNPANPKTFTCYTVE